MIEMIVACFLGVVIGDLVFLRVAQAKSIKKRKPVLLGYKNFELSYGIQLFWIHFFNKLRFIGIF